jgi:hypothetical protein
MFFFPLRAASRCSTRDASRIHTAPLAGVARYHAAYTLAVVARFRAAYNNMFVRLRTDYEIQYEEYFETVKIGGDRFQCDIFQIARNVEYLISWEGFSTAKSH